MRCPLRAKALQSPDEPFLISASGSLCFQEADLLASAYQSGLKAFQGSRLPVLLPQTPEAVCFFFACLREKVVLCPLNRRLPEAKLEELAVFLGSEKLWCELPKPGKAVEANIELDPDQRATVIFTSGSSGAPKAVPHVFRNHLASAFSSNAYAGLTAGDRWLCSLPFYHVGGLALIFRCVLAGAGLVFPEPGETLSESIRRAKPTHLSLVPTQLIRLLREEVPADLKRILLGGAPVPASLIEQAAALELPLAASYGMTETASQVVSTPPGQPVWGAGRVMAHAEVKIADSGEILIRGESVSEAVVAEDGWLHSGDRGRMEDGILFVEGRMDRQFISGGENIQPEQIEQALMSLEGVSQAVVRPVEDDEFGQRPAAWVDADPKPEWEAQLRQVLPGYMLPVAYHRLAPGVELKPKL